VELGEEQVITDLSLISRIQRILFEKEILDESRFDKTIFKAVFLAGAPGAGKSTVVDKSGLKALGFRVVNPDHSFERQLAIHNLPRDMEQWGEKGREVQKSSYGVARRQLLSYVSGMLGVVIDGTGTRITKITDQMHELEQKGYDCYMIMVNVPLEVSIQRQELRHAGGGRKLSGDLVTTKWNEIQQAIPYYKRIFRDKYFEIRSDLATDYDYTEIYKEFMKIVNRPVQNPIAKQVLDRI